MSKFHKLIKTRESESHLAQRLIYKNTNKFVAPTLAAGAEVEDHNEEVKPELENKVLAARKKREALVEECKSMGLSIEGAGGAFEMTQAIHDLSKADAEGRIIEASFTLLIKNDEDLTKAVQFCAKHKFLAMQIGSKTSGIGEFKAWEEAKMRGLKGVVGLKMRTIDDIDSPGGSDLKINIPEFNEDHYELVQHKNYPLAVLKSKDLSKRTHRVISHSSITISQINKFLKDEIRDPNYTFRLMTDLTTIKEAQLGGVISTGAEGGIRAKVSKDMAACTIINAHGQEVRLQGASAHALVGLSGSGGIVKQAEFEVMAFPKHRHGMFIPIKKNVKGKDWADLEKMLRLSNRLKKYSQPVQKSEQEEIDYYEKKHREIWEQLTGGILSDEEEVNKNFHLGSDEDQSIITGIEPFSRSALELAAEEVMAQGNKAEAARIQQILDTMGDNDYAVYIPFSANKPIHSAGSLELDFVQELLGFKAPEREPSEEDKDYEERCEIAFYEWMEQNMDQESEYFRVNHKKGPYKGMFNKVKVFLDGDALETMDTIRHAAPSRAKERGKALGGQTQSLDSNIEIRFEEKEYDKRKAEGLMAKVQQEYMDSFKEEDGFTVDVYGHLHPGLGDGSGGIDLHIRITYDLSHPGSRYNAPEQIRRMKKKKRNLNRDLMALHGQHGIIVKCPEKSRAKSADYWKWNCLYNPEEAREYLETIVRNGYYVDEDGNGYPIIGARIPHELPNTIPRIPNGIKGLLSKALIKDDDAEIFENSLHPVLQKHWKAILEICQLSHRGPVVKAMVRESALAVQEKFKLSNKQYGFFIECPEEAKDIVRRNLGDDYGGYNIEHVTLNSLEELEDPKFTDDENTFYVVNVEGIGVPKGLTVLVTPHSAVIESYERTLSGENKSAYRNLYDMWERWPAETYETPNLPAIASLGLLLDQDKLDKQEACDREPIVTVNPGPCQIDDSVMDGTDQLMKEYEKATSPGEQKKIIEKIKKFLGIPKDHNMAFFTSATEAMQMLSSALAKKKSKTKIIQVVNDAFSERFNDILVGEGNEVETITTPWTSSEHSYLDEVTEQINEQIEANDTGQPALVFITPHKTSTTADFHPDTLVNALAAEPYKKLVGKDYILVGDTTSAAGARNYATHWNAHAAEWQIGFNGMFASVQKALGQAPGLSFLAIPPQLSEALGLDEDEEFGLGKRIKDAKEGIVSNPFALAMLGQKLDAEIERGRTVKDIEDETREKVMLIMGWAQKHPDLMPIVQNGLDQSPLLVGLFSQSKNLVIAQRLMAEIFGFYIGGGYDIFKSESIRMMATNISKPRLMTILAAMDLVLETHDVTQTRGESVPNAALREPHEPFQVLKRMADEFIIDDIFKEAGALHWLKRLVNTYNANVGSDKVMDIGGIVPQTSSEFKMKAKIYGRNKLNMNAMRAILELRDPQSSSKTILGHYSDYVKKESVIKRELAKNAELRWDDESEMVESMRQLQDEAKEHLKAISKILQLYVSNGAVVDEKGNIVIPIVA